MAGKTEVSKATTLAKPELTKALIEDKLRPDEESDFKWKVTDFSKAWRILLNGTADSVIKPSSISTEIGSDAVNKALFAIIQEKGLEFLNTIEKVHSKGLAVKYEVLIYSLAACSCSENLVVKSRAYELVNKICDESTHFLQFIDFREKICKATKQTTGWSRGHRNAVQNWYYRKSPMEMAKIVMKCPRHNRWTHRDVLRLTHPVPNNEGQEVLCCFIVTGLKKTLEKYKNESEKKVDDSQKLLEFLEQVVLVRTGQETTKSVPIITKLKLSWDYVPCHLHKDPDLWKALIRYLPLTVLIPNICRMAKLKIFDGDSVEKDALVKKCSDAKEVKNSKLHPYNILMYRELYNNAMKDPKRKVSWKIDNQVLSGLNKALSLAMEYNLTPTGKRYFITIDASNSMKAHIINNNHVQCRVAAACMALCIARAEKKAIIKAFSKELADIKVDETTRIEDIVGRLEETQLGGTDCSRPLIFAKSKKIKTDVFIVFTDKETWSGKTTPQEALRQYRKTVKIPAKLVVIALNAEDKGKRVADPEDRGMLDIFGFSPSIPKMVSNFATYNF